MSSPNKKVKKKKGKLAGTPPIDSLQQPPHGASAGDYDGLDGAFEHGSDAGHSDAPSSAHSAEDSPDFPNDFITSLGLTTCTGLETLAAMVNASKPAHFHDRVVVARQVLDSGRDLTMVTPGTFEELCQSDFRNEIFQLLAHPRLSSFSVTDVLKAVPLLRDGVAVSVLVATIVAPVKLAVSPLVPAAQQSLLLTSEETKELDSFTKAIEGSKGWNFSKIVTVMTGDRSMTPGAITDLTRIFKNSFPVDKHFPGGFNGLNIIQIAALTPLAIAVQMGLTVNQYTDQLNFGDGQQGLFFADTTPALDSSFLNSPIYIQPAPIITPSNCAHFQSWSTGAAQGFIQGGWPLPYSCSLIYRKVVVFQELLYRFIVAFVTACVAANLGWAAGMLTTLETLRDTESVKEMPRAVITSIDAFLHGRVGDLFLAYRAITVLSTITTVVMGLTDFARVSTLFASTLDETKSLYQQMSKWHQLFHQLRGSLVSPLPGVTHPAVSLAVECQFLTAQLRAYEASSTSSRDQGAAQAILAKVYTSPMDLLAAIRVYSEGSSLTAPCFQSTGVSSAPANGHAHGALSGAGTGGGGGASGGSKGSGSTGLGGGGGSGGAANRQSKQTKAPAALLPASPSQPAPQKQRKGASANAGGGTPVASTSVVKKSPEERYHSLADIFVAEVPEMNTDEYEQSVDFGKRTVPRWICTPNASGQNAPLFATKEAFSKLTQQQRNIVQRMRGAGIPTSNDYIQGLSQARLITVKRTFAAQPQPPQHSPSSQQSGMPLHGGHLLQGSQQQSVAPPFYWAQGFAPQQHGYQQQFQSSPPPPLPMQQQGSVFYGQHVFPPHQVSQQPMHSQQPPLHPQQPPMPVSQQPSAAPAGHPGRHYGVPPPGFAQSFVALPFGSQQQQHGQTQQSLPPYTASGPAPGELPTVMHGSWRYGTETSGSPTGF